MRALPVAFGGQQAELPRMPVALLGHRGHRVAVVHQAHGAALVPQLREPLVQLPGEGLVPEARLPCAHEEDAVGRG